MKETFGTNKQSTRVRPKILYMFSLLCKTGVDNGRSGEQECGIGGPFEFFRPKFEVEEIAVNELVFGEG